MRTTFKVLVVVVVVVVAACVAAAVADSREQHQHRRLASSILSIPTQRVVLAGRPRSYGDDDVAEPPRYQFAYRLRAGGGDSAERSAEVGHTESRDGGRTDGRYFVQLPDGRLQTVEYYVDGDSGFVAKVSYDGVPVDDGRPRPY